MSRFSHLPVPGSAGGRLSLFADRFLIFSATEDSQIPFIDASDIAAATAEALTAESFPSGDQVLTGP